MSTNGTVPMLGADGQAHYVPQDQLGAALAAGGKAVAQMRDPHGAMRWVPSEQVDDARAAGGTVTSRAPTDDELQFLQQNPGHAWMMARPNAPEGVYPIGPGNEWRNNPDYAQTPIDLHLTAHTLQGAAEGAAAVAPAMALPAAISVTEPTTQLVRSGAGYMANWAEQEGPSLLRQAVSNPTVQQGLKMLGSRGAAAIGGAIGGGAAIARGYRYLRSIGVVQ